MNAMVKYLYFIFLISLGMGCGNKNTPAVSQAKPIVSLPSINFEQEKYIKGTVILLELDGCNYMVQLESGNKLEPVNLVEEFKKENLPVWIKYEVLKNASSICMAGEIVKVIDIKKRE
jgi:hypothetical protein